MAELPDLTERKKSTLKGVPGAKKYKYHPFLQDAIDQAKAMEKRTGEVHLVYESDRRHISCKYRAAPSWKGKWRGERMVWISAGAIPNIMR